MYLILKLQANKKATKNVSNYKEIKKPIIAKEIKYNNNIDLKIFGIKQVLMKIIIKTKIVKINEI